MRSIVAALSIVIVGAGSVMATVSAAIAESGYGEVTLENRTSRTLDLWVDGHYGCRALAKLDCNSMERAGDHNLTVQEGNTVDLTQAFKLPDGGTYTYTVTE